MISAGRTATETAGNGLPVAGDLTAGTGPPVDGVLTEGILLPGVAGSEARSDRNTDVCIFS